MASPVVTARQMPPGYKMPDGYQTTITLSAKPNVNFWERQVKPISIDGGDPIQTETMLNVAWRTTSPRHLKTLTPMTVQAAYDPDVILDMFSLINLEQSISYLYPEGSAIAFFGFLKNFEGTELKDGEFPIANITIVPTNWDPVNRVEAGPVFVAGPL